MTPEEYKRQFLGDFKPDFDQKALVDRLAQYYRDTPDSMSNGDALKHWKLFKRWCNERGYSQEQINQAKRDPRFRNI